MTLSRRDLQAGSAGLAAALGLPAPAALGQGKPRVVVIGGGAGGATTAKYIARDSAGAIAVTLVEENERYQTCFHSNLFVGGFRSYDEIVHRHDALAANYGITLMRSRAIAIERERREVVPQDGQRLPLIASWSRPAST